MRRQDNNSNVSLELLETLLRMPHQSLARVSVWPLSEETASVPKSQLRHDLPCLLPLIARMSRDAHSSERVYQDDVDQSCAPVTPSTRPTPKSRRPCSMRGLRATGHGAKAQNGCVVMFM